MSVNHSSSTNGTHLNPLPVTFALYFLTCLSSEPSSVIMVVFYAVNALILLPQCIFIVYLGVQRWKQQKSSPTPATMSHSDSFTYHMATIELIGLLGCSFSCLGILFNLVMFMLPGYILWSFTWYAENLFQTLTCAEHYLAVIHPIIYLKLRSKRGIKIRNIGIGSVWLISSGAVSLTNIKNAPDIVDLCFLIFAPIITSFCSLSVLCALIRPGPGEQGGDRERVDQSKRRAFHTTVAILGVLLLRCFWNLGLIAQHGSGDNGCILMACGAWLNIPSTQVLPLLFLHRAGKLGFCSK